MTDADQLGRDAAGFAAGSGADSWGMGCGAAEGDVRPPLILAGERADGMGRDALIADCLRLQRACVQLDSDNKVLAWELREANDCLLRFAKVAQLVHYLNAPDLDKVAELAVGELPQFFNCRFAAFYLYDNAGKAYFLYHSTHPVPDRQTVLSVGGGHFLARLFSHRNDPSLIEYDKDGYQMGASDGTTRTIFQADGQWRALLGDTAMVFPLALHRADGKSVALGGLILGKSECRLTEKDTEASMMLVDLLSACLNNANLVRQLSRMATTDVLTGLHNRRCFLTELEKAIAHTQRSEQRLSIAMLDIDHFKRVNDDHGHFCGDAVLKEIASLLRDSMRKNIDIPARYGGEEFIVIMPYTSLGQAGFFSERIRRTVENTPIVFENLTLKLTCSVGVAEYSSGETGARFIDRADAAMYRAKKNGRNQVASSRADDSTEAR